MRSRLPFAFVGLTVVAVLVDTAVTSRHHSLLSDWTWGFHGWPLATGATLGCSVMGALILVRYPRHRIGWLLCVAGLASVSMAAEAYAVWVLEEGGPGPELAGHVAAWLALLVGGQLAIAAVTMIYLLAPDGRLPSRRWRWAAWVTIVGITTHTVGILTVPPAEASFTEDSGEARLVPAVLTGVGFLLVVVGLVAASVSLGLRLRRAGGEKRSQLLWVALSAALLAFGLVWLLVVDAVQGGQQNTLAATPLFLAYLAFPVFVAVAVLRHRLFDLDLIVNRALVVALATGVVAAGYVLAVVVIGPAVGSGAGQFWGSLLATALVAMAFQPLRRRVVRLADRLAYGASATPYEALADFSRRLGDSPDPSALLPAVAEAAGGAVQARRAEARLVVPGGPDAVATWPAGALGGAPGPQVVVPVVDRGDQLGAVMVGMPAGRAARPQDRRLLQDLADQAAIAFRNARLSAELAGQVARLSGRTRELAASRRRVVTAADGERRRLERSIAREVVPHLQPLPARLDELARGAEPPSPGAAEPLLAAADAALDALREITRGVFPSQLSSSGLEPALSSLLARSGTGLLVVDPSAAGQRLDPRVEAAAYFCVVEASRDLDPPIEVTLGVPDGRLRVAISGRERGELTVAVLRDRVEAAGGTVTGRRAGEAMIVEVDLPTATAGVAS
jgi:hypothetical protein